MITAEVTLRVYSSVTGRTGNWSWSAIMRFAAVPAEGSYIIWTRPGDDGELTNRVKLVYHYANPGISDPGIFIDLEPTRTDSPDILNELMELHKDWEQHGGPWEGQDDEPADRH